MVFDQGLAAFIIANKPGLAALIIVNKHALLVNFYKKYCIGTESVHSRKLTIFFLRESLYKGCHQNTGSFKSQIGFLFKKAGFSKLRHLGITKLKNRLFPLFSGCLREHLTQHKDSVVTQKIDQNCGLNLKNSRQKCRIGFGFTKNWNFPDFFSQRQQRKPHRGRSVAEQEQLSKNSPTQCLKPSDAGTQLTTQQQVIKGRLETQQSPNVSSRKKASK